MLVLGKKLGRLGPQSEFKLGILALPQGRTKLGTRAWRAI
jgi:hypothetical protein